MNFILFSALKEIFGPEVLEWTLDEIKEEFDDLDAEGKANYEKLVREWLAERGITLSPTHDTAWFGPES